MKNVIELLKESDFYPARMISGSKSLYRRYHPDNEVYFNANIITESGGKIWHGDLDITLDREALEKIAKEIGEPLYVLSEMDARFENEDLPVSEWIKKAKVKI